MSLKTTTSCNNLCETKLDIDQIAKAYDVLDNKIRTSLKQDLGEKRIDGNMFTEHWVKLIGQTMNSIIGAVASLQAKETAMDRCVKQAECDLKWQQQHSMYVKDYLTIEKDYGYIGEYDQENDTVWIGKDMQNGKIDYEMGLLKSQIDLEDSKTTLTGEQTSKVIYEYGTQLPAQVELTDRQREGFDDNLQIKAFDAQNSAWAMMFSSGLMGDNAVVPPVFNAANLAALYEEITGLTVDPGAVVPNP